MSNMDIRVLPNPRKADGSFSLHVCDMCGASSGAYVQLAYSSFPKSIETSKVCKSCLLDWVKMIDRNILKQCRGG